MSSGNPYTDGRFSGELTGTVADFKLVKFSGDPTADTTTGQSKPQLALAADPTADQVAGIVYKGGVAGDDVEVIASGIVEGVAGAAFDRSAVTGLCTYDAAGEFIPWTPASGKRCIGRALFHDGSDIADGDPVYVQLMLAQPILVADTATVAAAAASVAVTLGAAFNGLPVVCTMAEADDTASAVLHASIAGGDLTITLDAAATADCTVHYMILA